MTAHVSARWGLAALFVAAFAASARADGLDKTLASNAKSVLAQLAAKKYANVGVLKFEVQTGGADGPVSMDAGRMNDTLATRLENALILATDEKNPIGIVRGASRAAAEKDKDATYHTREGRAKLFTHPYPLAWGNKTITPNAFLVGRLRFAPDMKKADLSLRLFDDKAPAEWQEVALACSQVDVGRQTLADANQPFVVPEKVFRKRGGDADYADSVDQLADRAVVPIATKPRPAPTAEAGPDPVPWDKVEPWFTFKVLYSGEEVRRNADGNYPPPKAGQEVQFRVRSTEKVGLVLLVNGINTADMDRTSREADGYVKWVLKPGEEYLIRGYYGKGQVFPFKAAADDAEAERQLSELASPSRIGQIELHIYREPEEGTGAATSAVVLRAEDGTADTLAELKEKIEASTLVAAKPVKKALIVPGEGQEQKLTETPFEGVRAAMLVVTYQPMPKRPGVPREPGVSPPK